MLACLKSCAFAVPQARILPPVRVCQAAGELVGRSLRAQSSLRGLPTGIIDCHVHVVDSSSPIFAQSAEGYNRHETSPEDIFAQWKQCGISAGVLSQPSFLGLDHSCMEAALRAHPQRFAGQVVLDWRAIEEAELRHLHALGVRGIRLNSYRGMPGGLPDLQSAANKTLFRRLADLGWHVELYAPCRQLVSELLPQLTEVEVLVDHFGMPEPEDESSFAGLLAAGKAGAQVSVMLSGDFRLSGQPGWVAECAAKLLEAFGPERLVWASDYPFTRYEHLGLTVQGQLEKFSTWISDSEAQRVILQETPRRIFSLDPA